MSKTRTHTPTQPTRHWSSVFLLALLTAPLWVGCSQEARVPADANSCGTYTLVSVDGNKVPCTVRHEGAEVAVKSGSFVINADGTCVSTSVFAVASGRDVNRVMKASYTCQGSRLTMKWEGAGTMIGTIEGGAFTMNNEGMIFAYHK